MKIFNREKTHFMQPSAEGNRNVKFGEISEIRALIDTILDCEKDKKSNSSMQVVSTVKSVKSNN